jgi:radical SAM superfamily enzyme YgiQ (UPF0313 family)
VKVTFIRPGMTPGRARDALEPLPMAMLAGLTPVRVARAFHDDRIGPVPFDEPTDLAAISVDTFSARRAYAMAAEYHARGVRVVMGGPHPTLCPDEALRFADAVVVGDAEDTWPQVLRDAEQGTLRRLYTSSFPPLARIRPDRSLYPAGRYGRVRLIQTGRGCRRHCDFCCVNAVYGERIRRRPLSEVVEEITATPASFWFFADDSLFDDTAAARDLCRAIRPLGLRWACQAGLDVVADPAVAGLLADSGRRLVLCGFESMMPDNLRQMGKEWTRSRGAYAGQVRVLHDHGIMVYGTFVFGYDADSPDSIRAALDFALDARLFLANFNPLIPFPGTPLHARLRRENRLIHDCWWLDPDYRFGQGMFHPRGMSAEALESGCYEAKTEFNRGASILRRALAGANAANPLLFLAANVASRLEIVRKQGRPLGDTRPVTPLHPEALPCASP